MKAAPFEYHRPHSLAEAVTLLGRLDDAKLLAGGQSLLAMMNFRYLTPAHLIDINRIEELAGVELEGEQLVLGAMTRQRDLERSPRVREHAPLVADALQHVGHVQTRNRGTVGGSLCHLDPSAELPGVLLALDAELELVSPRGARRVPMAKWCLGYMTPDLAPDELLARIRVPLARTPPAHGFQELARRHGDFALAGAAAVLALDGSRVARVAIAVIGVNDCPLRLEAAEAALGGESPTASIIERAAAAALELEGIDDVHASAAYRRRVAAVMVRRALTEAVERAGRARQ